ncbi:MAG: Crossover junction endodeoxyribonuclease RuvC [Calditrichaeota bacterium]|nr:Crossover junction endodeoxyribonuclease RuvC [Calditrichota bacterium]
MRDRWSELGIFVADARHIVLGFDPGTSVSGWAAVAGPRDPSLLDCGALRARAGEPIERRLRRIYLGALAVIERSSPDVIAVEDPFVGRNASGALTLGQARGVILLAAAQHGKPVVSYAPATIKQAVAGRGSADKEQVRHMVIRLLALDEPPEPLDASDAAAVALCHLNRGEFAASARGSETSSAGAVSTGGDANRTRASQLAANPEDEQALARWLAGGRRK